MNSNIEESQLSFEGYKIDNIDLKIKPSTAILSNSYQFEKNGWSYKFEIKNPVFIKKTSEYIGGLKISVAYFDKETPDNQKSSENALVELHISVTGIFKTVGQLDEATEQRLIKVNIPFILLPIIRATITNIFASSGFGSVTVPLINLLGMSDKILKIPITVIE